MTHDTSPAKLTKTQRIALDWIANYIAETDRSPSIREIMQGLNKKSVAPIQCSLDLLEKKGFITRTQGKARLITITDPTRLAKPKQYDREQIPQDLTRVAAQLLNYLIEYKERYGHPPTYREMMRALGLKSVASIQCRLNTLKRKGLIDWKERETCGIKLLLKELNNTNVLPFEGANGMINTGKEKDVSLSL